MDSYIFINIILSGILAPIGRMLRNKALMLQVAALSILNTAVFGYVNFDTASIQVDIISNNDIYIK